ALLEAALLNLAFNSLHALGTRGGTIGLHLRCDGETVEIAIRDTGPGFPEVPGFDPALPFHSTRENGLGLGLPIARAVIEAHDGTLTLRNREEGGAEALIHLPLHRPQET
ncbi:MAG: ATP-binding protein, partial [Limnochorda sp.]